jgi:hypothetical protein
MSSVTTLAGNTGNPSPLPPTGFTLSIPDKAVWLFLVFCAFGLGIGLTRQQYLSAEPPPTQPSVPSPISPACDGRCARPTPPRPFRIVCPYCRNPLVATPPETGEVGTVVGDLPAKGGK